MKKIKFILFLILILCQSSLISKSLLIENHSNLDDSTLVKYFYSNFDNHDLGYIIEETEEAYEAWGYTEEEEADLREIICAYRTAVDLEVEYIYVICVVCR